MSFLWQAFVKILDDYAVGTVEDLKLWLVIIQVINKSLVADEGGLCKSTRCTAEITNFRRIAFWRDDKLRQIAPVIAKQLPVCAKTENARDALLNCQVALVERISDDTLLKTTNLDILMHTRSEEARLRIFALTVAEAMWRAHGGKLLGTRHLSIFTCSNPDDGLPSI